MRHIVRPVVVVASGQSRSRRQAVTPEQPTASAGTSRHATAVRSTYMTTARATRNTDQHARRRSVVRHGQVAGQDSTRHRSAPWRCDQMSAATRLTSTTTTTSATGPRGRSTSRVQEYRRSAASASPTTPTTVTIARRLGPGLHRSCPPAASRDSFDLPCEPLLVVADGVGNILLIRWGARRNKRR